MCTNWTRQFSSIKRDNIIRIVTENYKMPYARAHGSVYSAVSAKQWSNDGEKWNKIKWNHKRFRCDVCASDEHWTNEYARHRHWREIGSMLTIFCCCISLSAMSTSIIHWRCILYGFFFRDAAPQSQFYNEARGGKKIWWTVCNRFSAGEVKFPFSVIRLQKAQNGTRRQQNRREKKLIIRSIVFYRLL